MTKDEILSNLEDYGLGHPFYLLVKEAIQYGEDVETGKVPPAKRRGVSATTSWHGASAIALAAYIDDLWYVIGLLLEDDGEFAAELESSV